MMNRIGFMLVTGFLLLTSNVYAEESPLSARISGAVICIAVEIWSLIDAPISAGRVNWEKRHPYESMFEKDFGTSVLGVNLTPTPQGAMVTALHF